MNKTILITGTSSGIGRAAVKEFVAKGWNVIATMRSPEKETELNLLPNVLVTELDVENTATIEAAIDNGIQRFGKIDAVVNNAGFGQFGIFESTSQEQIHKQFSVNVFGVMNVVRAILPHFRKQQSGTILNVSSGAGRFTLPLLTLYASSKFALEGYTEALSFELASQNISVKIVEPGGVHTNFHVVSDQNFAMNTAVTDYDSYVEKVGKMFERMRATRLATAEEVAELIHTAITDETDTLRYVIGEDAKQRIDIRSSVPDHEYMRLMRERYAV